MGRKIIFCFSLVVFWGGSVWGGDAGGGFKAGMSLSNMSGGIADELIESLGGKISSKIGFTGYGFVDIPINKYVGVEVDMGCGMKGGKRSLEDTSGKWEGSINLLYFQVPILVKGTYPLSPSISPYIYAGPSLELLAIARAEEHVEASGITADSSYNISDELNAADICLALGAGTEIAAGIGKITIDLRYTFSLKTVDVVSDLDKQIDPNAGKEKIKNWQIGLIVGYKFCKK